MQLDQANGEVGRLRQELAAEKQRFVDLEESAVQPLPLNPDLTPVDRDVFSMIEDDNGTQTGGLSSNQTKVKKTGTSLAGKLLIAFTAATIGIAAICGAALGTEDGRELLRSYLAVESVERIQSANPNHTGNRQLPMPGATTAAGGPAE